MFVIYQNQSIAISCEDTPFLILYCNQLHRINQENESAIQNSQNFDYLGCMTTFQ
mgnify:CR=1 FL=1